MSEDLDQKRKKRYASRRSILDIGMGIIIGGFGVFFMTNPSIKEAYEEDSYLLYMFAGLCLLYGAFRIYRGVQKNYFRED